MSLTRTTTGSLSSRRRGCSSGRSAAPGGGAGQLSFPTGVAVSGSGDVYAAERDNNRVSEFSQVGVFVRAFGKDVGGSGVDVCAGSCVAGSAGGGAGQLDGPRGVAVSGRAMCTSPTRATIG